MIFVFRNGQNEYFWVDYELKNLQCFTYDKYDFWTITRPIAEGVGRCFGHKIRFCHYVITLQIFLISLINLKSNHFVSFPKSQILPIIWSADIGYNVWYLFLLLRKWLKKHDVISVLFWKYHANYWISPIFEIVNIMFNKRISCS